MSLNPILAAALVATTAFAQAERVQLDPALTRVNWTLGDILHTVRGTFKVKSAELWFDPATGQAGGRIVVDARSGESGSSARDGRMHKNILESDKYPDITLAPDHVDGTVNLQGDSNVKLHGAFTIHGGTHAVVMSVTSHIDRGKLTAAITFPVPYVQWGMKNPSTFFLRVKDTVQIEIQATGEIRPSGAT
jgi:polyisoprenoid-binding protein YceI